MTRRLLGDSRSRFASRRPGCGRAPGPGSAITLGPVFGGAALTAVVGILHTMVAWYAWRSNRRTDAARCSPAAWP